MRTNCRIKGKDISTQGSSWPCVCIWMTSLRILYLLFLFLLRVSYSSPVFHTAVSSIFTVHQITVNCTKWEQHPAQKALQAACMSSCRSWRLLHGHLNTSEGLPGCRKNREHFSCYPSLWEPGCTRGLQKEHVLCPESRRGKDANLNTLLFK